MVGRRHAGYRAMLALLFMLALACVSAPVCAYAQDDLPSGAVVAPVTPKPWLVPLTTDATGAPQTTLSAQAAQTMPPSSLEAITAWGATVCPTAEPTAEPTQVADVLPAELGLTNPSVFRVLLIGTDSYSEKKRGRSDTMLLMQLNTQTNQVKLVSFLRDLYVKIPGYSKTRLNAAYVFGDAELLEETLANNFGVTVDRYIAVSFPLMVKVIDRLGGVTVEVSDTERVQLNSILKYYNKQNGWPQSDQLLESAGLQMLSGKQALCFSRIRKTDSDFKRVNRQRKVIEAIFERLRGMDVISLTAVAMETFSDVRTDLTLADITALVPAAMNLNGLSWDSLTVPVDGGYRSQKIAGMDVLTPDLERNRNAIADFLQ